MERCEIIPVKVKMTDFPALPLGIYSVECCTGVTVTHATRDNLHYRAGRFVVWLSSREVVLSVVDDRIVRAVTWNGQFGHAERTVQSCGTDSSVSRNGQFSHPKRTVQSRGTDSSVTWNGQFGHVERTVRSRGTDSSVTWNGQFGHVEQTVRSRGTNSAVTRNGQFGRG